METRKVPASHSGSPPRSMDHLASLTSLSHFLLITYRYIESQAQPFSSQFEYIVPQPDIHMYIRPILFGLFSSPPPFRSQSVSLFHVDSLVENAYRSFYLDNPTKGGGGRFVCGGLTEFRSLSFLSFSRSNADRVETHTPRPLPIYIYGMPISSTMLLILIYMTRPTATPKESPRGAPRRKL